MHLYSVSNHSTLDSNMAWQDLQCFIVFIGYGRSGHSLVGSLLDAHPEVVIAHEHDAVAAFEQGQSRVALFADLLANSRERATSGRVQTGYRYDVPGQFQGTWRGALRVLGDKRGGMTALRLGEQPQLVTALRSFIGLPLRVILVVRNPYDIVASMVRNNRKGNGLGHCAESFTLLTRYNAAIMAQLAPEELCIIRHEDLIAAPQQEMARLCEFLGVAPEPGYLDACAGVVAAPSTRARDRVEWDAPARRTVAEQIAAYPFLAGYTFD